MSRGPDAATLLRRSLARNAAAAQLDPDFVTSDWTRWASATFTGARHQLTLRMRAGAIARSWLADLPEADLPLRGHLVADLDIERISERDGELTVAIEALTVEER